MHTETNHRFKCWNCHTNISAKHAGSTCPHCGASLVVEDFDVVAYECARRYQRITHQARVLRNRLKKLERPEKRFSPLSMLLFLTARPWKRKLRNEIARCARAKYEAKRELFELSKGRWFAGSWYKSSGETPGEGHRVRRARYNTAGCFIVTPGQSRWRNPKIVPGCGPKARSQNRELVAFSGCGHDNVA